MNRRLLVLLLACLGLVAGLTVAAPRPLPLLQAAGETYTGVLTAIWTDYEDGHAEPPRFYLSTSPDETFALTVPDALLGKVQGLLGEPVVVTARPADEIQAQEAPGEYPLLMVDRLEPAMEGVQSTTGSTKPVSGNTRWITIGCKFPDRLGEAHPLSYFAGMYANTFPGLNHYWREVSDSQINLDGSTTVGWYTLPRPYADYFLDSGTFISHQFRDDCEAAADADVYFPDYYGVNLIVNGDDLTQAFGSVGTLQELDGVTRQWATTWMTQWSHKDISVFAHEMGHGYALFHSYADDYQYGNVWDVMSNDRYNCSNFYDAIYGCYGQHTIANNRLLLGWIESDRLFSAGPGIHKLTLERLALPGSSGYLLAKVPIDNSDSHYYTVEARRLVGYDKKLPADAVIIHEIGVPPDMFELVINGSGGATSPGAKWLPGETYYSAENRIGVHVEAATASGFSVTIWNGIAAATASLIPTDDTYVNQNAPGVNYGQMSTIRAVDGGGYMRGALKFDVQQMLSSAYRVRLRLAYVDDAGLEMPCGLSFTSPTYKNSTVPWTEAGLTWNNWSTVMTFLAADEPPSRDGTWVEWNITEAVVTSGNVTFAVGNCNAPSVVSYSSKEGPNPPQLIVDYLVPPGSATATPTATATATASPTPKPPTATPTSTRKPPTATPTATKTAKPTATNTPQPPTWTPTPTATATNGPSPTATATSTPGPSPTATATASPAPSVSATPTASATPPASATPTASPTPVPVPGYEIWLPLIRG